MFAGEPLSYRSKDVESQSSEYRVLFKIEQLLREAIGKKAEKKLVLIKQDGQSNLQIKPTCNGCADVLAPLESPVSKL